MKSAAPPAPPRLVYVNDTGAGIRRMRHGRGFRYVGSDGASVRDRRQIARIRSIGIPPAYRDVWICPLENGHLQATGRDARGRKQYLYHAEWRNQRDAAKFDRMLEFGRALGRIRARVDRDLAAPELGKDRVTAAIVRLLDTTCMRIGNHAYARANRSYGLTTLRNRHATVEGEVIRLSFRGKSGVLHRVELADPRVARLVRSCVELPGQELFQHVDADGVARGVGSSDVNAYLQQITGSDFTAKDFRTWHASVDALELLSRQQAASQTEARRLATAAIREVAARLGNTVAVCRKAYVHPVVLESFLAGTLAERLQPLARRSLRGASRMKARERRALAFLAAACGADGSSAPRSAAQ
jgi:DNA topoisomerase-1